MTEIWKSIPSTNGRYLASNTGKIASTVYRFDQKRKIPKLITSYKTEKGYWRCAIRDIAENNYSPIYRFVHRLVAETFIPKIDGKNDVNHKDGNKDNNTPQNLEWVTTAENNIHAWQTGLFDNNLKLSSDQISDIYNSSLSPAELCKIYNVGYGTIYTIRSAKRKIKFDPNNKSKCNIYLSSEKVAAIFLSKEKPTIIAKHHNITYHLVWRIKAKRVYSAITEKLNTNDSSI